MYCWGARTERATAKSRSMLASYSFYTTYISPRVMRIFWRLQLPRVKWMLWAIWRRRTVLYLRRQSLNQLNVSASLTSSSKPSTNESSESGWAQEEATVIWVAGSWQRAEWGLKSPQLHSEPWLCLSRMFAPLSNSHEFLEGCLFLIAQTHLMGSWWWGSWGLSGDSD